MGFAGRSDKRPIYPLYPSYKDRFHGIDRLAGMPTAGVVAFMVGPAGGGIEQAGSRQGKRAMTNYRLHYFPESGNSYKLALMLTLCGQPFEPVWTDFGGGVTRTAQWRQTVNQMGEIPVLEDGEERLTQTAPILLSLAARHGQFGGHDS
jgi:hypothetical protein